MEEAAEQGRDERNDKDTDDAWQTITLFKVVADLTVKGPVDATDLHPALTEPEIRLGISRYFVAEDLEHADLSCRKWIFDHYEVIDLDIWSITKEHTKLLLGPAQMDVILAWGDGKHNA